MLPGLAPRILPLFVVLSVLPGLGPGVARAAISSCPGLIATWGWTQRPSAYCEQQGKIAQESFYIAVDCRTGGPAGIFPMTCSGVTLEEYDAKGGPHPPNDCVSSVTPVFQINDCDATGKAPDPSKAEASKCEAYFADPVALATGALQQRATDLDLGSGLRFERFYSSDLYGAAYAPTAELAPMGQKWEHGLDWRMRSALTPEQASYGEAYFIRRPLRVGVVFVRPASFATFSTSASFGGSLAKLAGGSFLFTDEDGTRVRFDAALQLTGIQTPGAPPIMVTASEGTQTFTQGAKSLAITLYGGPAHAGRVASVAGGGQTWTYSYDANENLETVTGPDTSSGESGATVTWTYGYDATDPAGHLVSVERTAANATKILGSWSFDDQSPRRVISAD
ncbi:MAG: hypothetical protein IT386_18060, partial [Deltaproteobacteria bacterium]|nr:hypothetical protein [Deltaproteobacteria bacterium]